MSTIKTILMLLAFLGVYGIVGRMDYDDAVKMENAQRQSVHMDCLPNSIAPESRLQPVQTGLTEFPAEPANTSADPCNVLIY